MNNKTNLFIVQATSPHRKLSLPTGTVAVSIVTVLVGTIGFKAGTFAKTISEIRI